MKEIYYIRFNSGDEVVGEIMENNETNLIVNNPLLIENTIDEEGSNVIYMTRFNPYALDTSVSIDHQQVLMIQTVSVVMEDYYSKSVDFCKAYIDQRFTHGIKVATNHVDQALTALAMNGELDDGGDPEYDPEEVQETKSAGRTVH